MAELSEQTKKKSDDKRIKVVVIGAGSKFTQVLVTDILNIPSISGGEIGLVDIDEERLALAHQLMEVRMIPEISNGNWNVKASTDRRKILPDADYIINTIEVAGLEAVHLDYEIPLKYGVDQCIGDTLGPGGLMKTLRTTPDWTGILKDAEELCPDALILNYTNPMSMLCLVASKISNMQVVGLCHSVQETGRYLARHAGIPYEEMQWKCGGINHMAWFTELTHKGQDLYPILFEKAKDHNSEFFEESPIRADMILHFGGYITESSGHLSEYIPYYRKRKDLLKKYTRSGQGRGESGSYTKNWPIRRKECDENRRQLIAGKLELKKDRSHEFAGNIVEAHHTNRPLVIHGNVVNHGLIDNLPQESIVEVCVMIDRNGFNPCRFGPLPNQMAALCQSNISMIEMSVIAALEESREAAAQALMLDPLTAAVCSPSEIKNMANELIDSQSHLLAEGFKE